MKKFSMIIVAVMLLMAWMLPALGDGEFANEDLSPVTDTANATQITLSDDGITVAGTGANAQGSIVTITHAGTYAVTGDLSEGQILIDLIQKGKVYLVLNGMSIHCTDSAAIHVLEAKKVLVTLAEGTENFVSDGTKGVTAELSDDDPTAAFFSKDDLIFNGLGALTVTGNQRDGITGRDTLKFVSGQYNITAADDGIVGKDCLVIREGTYTINAGADGMKSSNAVDSGMGYISLLGGIYDITAGNDGIQGETNLLISGGQYTIACGGGSVNASYNQEQMGWNAGWGQWGNSQTDEAAGDSAKGLKAGQQISISAGVFQIDSSDDAIHSDGNVDITAGTFDITSGDDGIHADDTLQIAGGVIDIAKSYEGLEAEHINITGGAISLIATDDGLNAAGGQDESGFNRPGRGGFQSSGNGSITVTGGTIWIDATGDGIDANGSVSITGGQMTVAGPTSGGNGALDYDSDFEISGGTVAAFGSMGMSQAPSNSQVPCISASAQGQAGDVVTLTDASGTAVWTYTAEKSFQTIIYASDTLQAGEYTLTVGSESYAVTLMATGITSVNGGIQGSFGGGGPGGGKR